MNQRTHAWLAVEAYRKIKIAAKDDKSLDGLRQLLGEHLGDVVVAAWLPDSLIKDMAYGHVFKNSAYAGDQKPRFTLSAADLKKTLPAGAKIPSVAFPLVPDKWWKQPYRVKDNGGHLPARVNALCQTARDMLNMGDDDVLALSGAKRKKGAADIAAAFRYSPRDVAMMLWMLSHYVADGHMPFHSDNRTVASTSANSNTHGAMEDLWGEQVPPFFARERILRSDEQAILEASYPVGSKLADIPFGDGVPTLKGGDPWKAAVYICRAGFAASFAIVPESTAPVDSGKDVPLKDIRSDGRGICGEARFWDISRAVMHDAANAIAMFWIDIWADHRKTAD